VPIGRKHRPPVRPTNLNARNAVASTERGGTGREVIALKRVATTRAPKRPPTGVQSKGIGRPVFIPSRPANDVGHHHAAVLALVDDLAALAAELFAAGRLPPENAAKVTDSADKKGRGGV
jgi:hypothetical protein